MTEPAVLHQKINLPYRYTAGDFHKAFLYGLADRRIVGSRCSSCNTLAVPARPFCPDCSAHSAESVEMAAEGTLESWSTVVRDGASRTFGLIRIGSAYTLMLHLVDADPAELAADMKVVPRWAPDPAPDITAIDAFVPA